MKRLAVLMPLVFAIAYAYSDIVPTKATVADQLKKLAQANRQFKPYLKLSESLDTLARLVLADSLRYCQIIVKRRFSVGDSVVVLKASDGYGFYWEKGVIMRRSDSGRYLVKRSSKEYVETNTNTSFNSLKLVDVTYTDWWDADKIEQKP